MNLEYAYVVQILGEPTEKNGRYYVKVYATCWGANFITDLSFSTLEETKTLTINHRFLT